jgi:hypothetical protein
MRILDRIIQVERALKGSPVRKDFDDIVDHIKKLENELTQYKQFYRETIAAREKQKGKK